jgi:PBSX family phage terminase large subunit
MFKKTKIQVKALNLFLTSAKEFLLYGGSRSSKTFTIVYVQLLMALKFPGSRHLIARFRYNAVKAAVWNDTLKKVLKICFNNMPVKWNSSDHYIELANGSQIWIAGLDDADRVEKILGMEFLTIFLNEASQISYDSYNVVKTRLAQLIKGARNLLFIDENPPSKKHWTYKVFIEGIDPKDRTELDRSRYGAMLMNPLDNHENISPEYMEILNSMPLRKRQRFLEGKFSDDTEGALWSDEIIAKNRVITPPTFKRIVVAIDPAVTSKDTSDETGIVAVGIDFKDHVYPLEDVTGTYTPTEWAKQAIALYRKHKADRIVGEVNNGGDLIETVLRGIDANIPYTSVHATRDKLTRAEPVAALYEQGKGHHVGELLELELEMTTWAAKTGEKSPNRIDALVWGVTELTGGSLQTWDNFN